MTMTDTELESRVVATLRAKGAQVVVPERSFDPDLVALTPLAARGRRRVPVLVAAVVALVVAIAIGVALVLVDQRESSEPAGEPGGPFSQLQIVALPSLSYQAREFTTEPGRTEIEFRSSGGTHTLVFEDPSLRGFELEASEPLQRDIGVVELVAGRDYKIYDVIPGHREAGMEAVIHVTAGPPGPTRESYAGILSGDMKPGDLPLEMQNADADYLQIGSYGGHGTYIKRLDFFPIAAPDVVPVYSDDLTTVVGHYVPDRGFVPLGEDQESVPAVTPTTSR